MLKRLKALINGTEAAPKNAEDGLRLATCALLLEAAVLDGHFDDAERATISGILTSHFAMNDGEAATLIDEARTAVEEAAELYGFAKTIKDAYAPEDRIAIIEMLWRVAYADGELHDYESNLVRRVAGLIYVPDRDSGLARKRVLAEMS